MVSIVGLAREEQRDLLAEHAIDEVGTKADAIRIGSQSAAIVLGALGPIGQLA